MNCPICGNVTQDGQEYCSVCGASFESFANVTPEMVINYQTPAEHERLGDDSKTLLIPSNYETAIGDDSKTVLIPSNYETAVGDDSRTVYLPENATGEFSQQPLEFTLNGDAPQQAYGQTSTPQQMNRMQPGVNPQIMNYSQPGVNPPNMNYGQPGVNPANMNYGQPGVNPVNMNFNQQNNYNMQSNAPAVPANTGLMKLLGIFAAVSAIITVVFNVIFLTNPIYYIFQHFVGKHEDFQEAWESGELMTKSAQAEFITTCSPYCIVSIMMLTVAAVIAIVGIFKTVNKFSGRPAIMFPALTLVTAVIGSGSMLFFKIFFGLGFKLALNEDSNSDEMKEVLADNGVFNCYDFITVFIIITLILVVANMIVAKVTENKWLKANNANFRR